MGFIITEGCCGLSLQTSCFIIGIVYFAMNIISCLTNLLLSLSPLIIFEPVLFMIFSLCLIAGTMNEMKGFLIPWMVGFGLTCFSFIMLFVSVAGAGTIYIKTDMEHKPVH